MFASLISPLLSLVLSQADVVVSPQWLHERVGAPATVVIELAGGMSDELGGSTNGHIPGARLAGSMVLHSRENNGLPSTARMVAFFESMGVSDDSHVVLYGDPMSVGRAYVALRYLGHAHTSILPGGASAWRAAGYRLESTRARFARGRIHPRLREDLIADAAWVSAHLRDPDVALLDVRSPEEYVGLGHMAGDRPGHIPGARNLDWANSFISQSSATLKDDAALRKLFASAGAIRGKVVLIYCTAGMRASHAFAVAESIGLTARFYGGSMNDWTSGSIRPVKRGSSP